MIKIILTLALAVCAPVHAAPPDTARSKSDAVNDQGIVSAKSADKARALKRFKSAVKLDPSNEAARYNLARALWMLGRNAEAEPQAREAARLDPRNPKPLLLRASILKSLDRFEEGLDAVDQALELDPGSREAVYLAANMNYCLSRFEAAEGLLGPPEAKYGVDFAHLRAANLLDEWKGPEALAAAELALRLDDSPLSHCMRADALGLVGRNDEAIAEATPLIGGEEEADARYVLANAARDKGDKAEALRQYLMASALYAQKHKGRRWCAINLVTKIGAEVGRLSSAH